MLRDIQEIRHQLTLPLPGSAVQGSMAPYIRGVIQNNSHLQKAGVLILLFPIQENLKTIFIKRTEYKGPHSGQISFPGGKSEPGDNSIITTALREAEEEIGIDRGSVDILGQLTPLEIPVSSFKVFPVVGYTKHTPVFKPEKSEVEFLIEIDIRSLIDPALMKAKIMKIREFEINVPYFDIQGNHIWGATAMILAEFREILVRAGIFAKNS
ncbi:MAG: CoA pyrophosphatase [Bacteroidales bacterium]